MKRDRQSKFETANKIKNNFFEASTPETSSNSKFIIKFMELCRIIPAIMIFLLPTVVFTQTSSYTYPLNGYTPTSSATGSPLGSYSVSDIENVNLFSGNLNVTIPLMQIGGRGSAGYSISLPIEHKWRIQDAYYPGPGPWPGGPPPPEAWQHHYYPEYGNWNEGAGFGPGIMRSRRNSTFQGFCPASSGQTIWGGQVLTQMTFIGPGGTEMNFFDRRTGGTPTVYPAHTCNITPDGANRGNVWVTGDGSNVVFVTSGNFTESPGSNHPGIGAPSGDMYFPDGTHYKIVQGNVTSINDRNGNKVSFTYSGAQVATITDSLNRTLTNVSSGIITYSGVGGASRTIEIGSNSLGNVLQTGYTLKSNSQLFPELGADVQNQTTPQNFSVTSYVRLPNGKQYNFKYNSYGDIARIELPTGGAIEYDWDGVAIPGCGARVKRWVTERRVYPNGETGSNYETKTTYSRGSGRTVTTYSGNTPISVSKHYFTSEEPGCTYGSEIIQYQLPTGQYGREYKTEIYTADGTTLLRKTETDFDFRTLTAIYGNKQVDYRPIRVTTTLADVSPNLVSKQEFGYDQNVDLTRQTDVWEYDYGSNQAGPLKRYSHTDYISTNPVNSINYLDNSIRLVNLVAQTWVSSDLAGANKLSLAKYEYDNYSSDSQHAQLLDRNDITGHLRTDNPNAFNTSHTWRGNLTKVTKYINAMNESAGSVSVASQFDIAGNIVKIIDAKGNASTISYNDNFGVPDSDARLNTAPTQLNGKQTYAFATSSSNPLQFTSYAQFDYHTSLPVNSEDVNGIISKRIYNDLLDRSTQSVVAVGTPLEQQSAVSYDDTNRIVTGTSDFNSLGDNQLKTESLYDGLGRTLESRRYQSDGTFIATRNKFDALGRAYKTTNPFKQGTSENNLRWTKSEFDDLSRIIKIILPDDTPGTDADNATVKSEYLGNTKTITDQAGKKRKGITNAFGQMVQVIEDPNGQSLTTDYTFDAIGNLRKIVQGVQNRYFLYDSLGRVIRGRQPEQGTNSSLNLTDTLTGNSQWSIGYSYDNNGNILTTTDARNITVTGTYDELNRLTLRDYSDTTMPDVTFVYDMTNIQGTSFNYKGGLTKVITGDPLNPFSVNYNSSVDILGRVKASQQITDSNSYNFPNYSYNLAGILTSQTYPSGKVVNNEYQTDGDLSRVTGQVNINSGSKLYASAFSYTETGSVKSMRLGNGKWETAQFNSRLQVTQIGLGTNETDTSLLKLELSYGANNQNNMNLHEQKISFAGLAQPIVQTYTYDSLNRLQSATETNQGNATVIWKETFNYDRYGNRSFDELNTSSITLGCTITSQNPNGVCNKEIVNPQANLATNRFADGQTYEYDSAGNLIKDAEGKQFAYDADNHQKSFGLNGSNSNGGQYFYDGSGKRVKTSIPSQFEGTVNTIFVYDTFGKLTAEYENTPSVSNPTTKYLTADHLGTPRIITDKLGGIVSRHDYRAFGEELIAGTGNRTVNQKYSSQDDVRRQYTGYERDFESGLDYAQARYYNNRHGRFTSVDPLTASASTKNPQTFNRYSYSLNNPYKYTDPSGLYSECGTRPDICENTTRAGENAAKARQSAQYRDGKGGNPTGPTNPFQGFIPKDKNPFGENVSGIPHYTVNIRVNEDHRETSDTGITSIVHSTTAQFRAYLSDSRSPHRTWTATYKPYVYQVKGQYKILNEKNEVVQEGEIDESTFNITETGEIDIIDIVIDSKDQFLEPGDEEQVYEADSSNKSLTVILAGSIIFHPGTTNASFSTFTSSGSLNTGITIKETFRKSAGGPIYKVP